MARIRQDDGIAPEHRAEKEQYRVVLLLGEDTALSGDILELYKQPGYKLIGDGNIVLARHYKELLEGLRDRIGPTTRIYISAHGNNQNGTHKLGKFFTQSTKAILRAIEDCNTYKHPLDVRLSSCFAGAAAEDVIELSKGSVLVTYAPENDEISAAVDLGFIFKSSGDLHFGDPVEDFVNRFALNTKQTTTIAIHKGNNEVFKHTIQTDCSVTAQRPEAIAHYLMSLRSTFVNTYNQEFGDRRIDIGNIPAITVQDSIDWCRDRFYTAIINGDNQLTGELNHNIEVFSDYINYAPDGHTALMFAAMYGRVEMVSALLRSRDINAKAQNKNGDTAITLLFKEYSSTRREGQYDETIAQLLAHDNTAAAQLAHCIVTELNKKIPKEKSDEANLEQYLTETLQTNPMRPISEIISTLRDIAIVPNKTLQAQVDEAVFKSRQEHQQVQQQHQSPAPVGQNSQPQVERFIADASRQEQAIASRYESKHMEDYEQNAGMVRQPLRVRLPGQDDRGPERHQPPVSTVVPHNDGQERLHEQSVEAGRQLQQLGVRQIVGNWVDDDGVEHIVLRKPQKLQNALPRGPKGR
jgi:hypothetical protein